MRNPTETSTILPSSLTTYSTSTTLDDASPRHILRYGDSIRLWCLSWYEVIETNAKVDPLANHYLGYYQKKGKHGILSCLPPLGPGLQHLFVPEVFTVTHPWDVTNKSKRYMRTKIKYGFPMVLVNQQELVWNNKTGGVTGYIGPREVDASGRITVACYKTCNLTNPSDFVMYGDTNVELHVLDSNRHTKRYNKALTNFKKPTSDILGGYICCDGKGECLKVTIYPAEPSLTTVSSHFFTPDSLRTGVRPLTTAASSTVTVVLSEKQWGDTVSLTFDLTSSPKENARPLVSLQTSSGGTLSLSLLALVELSQQYQSTQWLPLRQAPGGILLQVLPSNNPAEAARWSSFTTHMTQQQQQAATVGAVGGGHSTMTTRFLGRRRRLLGQTVAAWSRNRPSLLLMALLMAGVAIGLASGLSHGVLSRTQAGVLAFVLWSTLWVVFLHDALHLDSATSTQDHTTKEQPTEGRRESCYWSCSTTSTSHISLTLQLTAWSFSLPTLPTSLSTTPPEPTLPEMPKRFLEACKGDHEAALVRWKATLAWRESNDMDYILSEPSEHFTTIKQYYPHAYHLRGYANEPVYYESPGQIDLKALKGAGVNLEMLLRHYALVTEFLWERIEDSHPTTQCIYVLNLKGLGLFDFGGEVVEFVKQAAGFVGKHYPGRSKTIFVLNAPSWFNVIWNVMKPYIDEVTREKITIVRGNPEKITAALLEKIPLENLPPSFGGTSVPLGESPQEKVFASVIALNNAQSGKNHSDDESVATSPMRDDSSVSSHEGQGEDLGSSVLTSATL